MYENPGGTTASLPPAADAHGYSGVKVFLFISFVLLSIINKFEVCVLIKLSCTGI